MRKFAVLVITVVTASCLVACGSSAKSAKSSTKDAAASAAPNTNGLAAKAGLTGKVNFDSDPTNIVATPTSDTQEIELSSYYIGPSFINVKAGTTLHATLKNAGKITHTFTIDSLHIDKTLSPGATATVDITIPASGALQFYCRFHRSMGMQGAIFATSATSGASQTTAATAATSTTSSSGY
jgi:plastocyanin